MDYITLFSILIGFIALAIYLKSPNKSNEENQEKIILDKLNNDIKDLTLQNGQNRQEINDLQKRLEVSLTKVESYEALKMTKTQLEERLKNIENERNQLKNSNISLKESEETRNSSVRKSLEATITLQESLEKEKERLNDERVKENEEHFENMKLTWGNHEKDVESHLKMICRNNIINYVSQEDFPHPRNKPDNSIEIMDQLIIFDAKSPANDDLSNFPKYIKLQTENLKKYAKHENVKNDLFLVIPSNTLNVIKQFSYNIGEYNVYVITKDALEPIILSLKKIEEYEFADKLSPEERDNICRIIGKFAHTTKRRIQIDQFFAEEFLDTLSKARNQLPREILESVIQFENADKLNPPMEKRNKEILTKDLKEKSLELKKEIEMRNIPEITTKIEFKD
jgi:hypothetical protein|tara:strand:- start:187 stop:1377 length:1191 start_codon:yes stop_codon:yes gene_type:complete